MLDLYKRLEAEGKIGQFDEHHRPRPFQEYPKWVMTGQTDDKGTPVKTLVQNQREELAVAAQDFAEKTPDDPIVAERNRLAQENERLRRELAEIAAASAKPAIVSPPAPKAEPVGDKMKELVK